MKEKKTYSVKISLALNGVAELSTRQCSSSASTDRFSRFFRKCLMSSAEQLDGKQTPD